jgi:hypothetical protein
MRAHEAVYIDVVLLEQIQEALCESTLSILAINYQLSNPTHSFVIERPTAGECVTSKLAIDSNPDIEACGIIREVLRSKPVLTETYSTACLYLADECI